MGGGVKRDPHGGRIGTRDLKPDTGGGPISDDKWRGIGVIRGRVGSR